MNLLQRFRNESNYNQILVWAKRFYWADSVKKQAWNQYHLYRNNDIMDKRMTKIWAWVEEVEPIKTFEGGSLSSKARGLLAMAKISNVFK